MPAVTKVEFRSTFNRGHVIVVHFGDRHRITFFPNYGGFGQPSNLEEIKLTTPSEMVAAQFFVPNQSPRNAWNDNKDEPDYGFQKVPLPYVCDQIVDYVLAAWTHIASGNTEGLRHKWSLIASSHSIIADIQNGRYPVPS